MIDFTRGRGSCGSRAGPADTASYELPSTAPEVQAGTQGADEGPDAMPQLPEPIAGNDPGVARMLGAVALTGVVLLVGLVYGLSRLLSG